VWIIIIHNYAILKEFQTKNENKIKNENIGYCILCVLLSILYSLDFTQFIVHVSIIYYEGHYVNK